MLRIGCSLLTLAWMTVATVRAQEDAAAPIAKVIDDAIGARLKKENIQPAGRADDARLLRRIYLDVLGRIPTVAEADAYFADTAPARHHRLVDKLLDHPEMPVYWRTVVDGWFNGPLDRQARQAGHDDFLQWLQRSIEQKKPWDRLAKEMIVPDASDPDQQGAAFFLTSRLQGDKVVQLDNVATGVASALFGVQLQCAKCHDHPFVDEWKQDHYYGLAAFFSRVEAKNQNGKLTLGEKAAGEVKFQTRKKGEKTAVAIFLDNVNLDPSKEGTKRREKLVEHALKPESPYFKRAVVNRVWKQLMGRGLVEPVDQIHSANPASHPQLLESLAEDFAGQGFQVRRLMSGILHSDAYHRDSRFAGAKRPGDDLYAAAVLKPLTGQQMAWSLAVAAGHTDQLAAKYAKDLKPAPEKGTLNPALRLRWEREVEFDQIVEKFRSAGETYQANAGQALFATFNPFTLKLLQPAAGNLAQRLAAEKDNQNASRLGYLAILSRGPTAEEASDVANHFAAAKDRNQAASDLVWALLASAEFRFNH